VKFAGLNPDSHQTSMISTAYEQSALQDAGSLMSRWSQENFFRYMMQHDAIDLLSEYQTEEIPGTNKPVVHPLRRAMQSAIRSVSGKLTRRRAEFAAHATHPEIDLEGMPQWEQRKQELLEPVEALEEELVNLKVQRESTPRHLRWEDYPEEDKFERLAPSRKRLLDTVKMVAYRCETAMVNVVREVLARADDARPLIRELLCSSADLKPNVDAGTLIVRIHPMSTPRWNQAIGQLLQELTATETHYPGTTLRLIFEPIGAP